MAGTPSESIPTRPPRQRAADARNAQPAASIEWHAEATSHVLDALGVTRDGLSAAESARRQREFGPNTVVIARRESWWRILARQLRSLVVLLLAGAAVGAFLVGDRLEGLAICAVLALNTALGFSIEMWARREMEALRRLEVQAATVRRSGEIQRIDARALVPGDVLVLTAGEAIPADARLLRSTELQTIEAPLTGESGPILKSAKPTPRGHRVPLAERSSMVYKGTLVATGTAEAVVVATGRATEMGRITELVQETEETRSPLEARLDELGRRLVWICVGISGLIAALGALRGQRLWLMIETGIALAVAAVPEGLPVVATITLALGMRRMARRHALVRTLSAVETLGSATLVCADKTGTLTAGEMTVTEYHLGDRRIRVSVGEGDQREFVEEGRRLDPSRDEDLATVLRIGVLCNRADARAGSHRSRTGGDPTEVALLAAGRAAGLDPETLQRQLPEQAKVPFSSRRRLMATFHQIGNGRHVLYVKGAPQRILESSVRAREAGREVPLDGAAREALVEANLRLAGRGLRVLAFAYRELEPGEPLAEPAIHDLTFAGLVGITDPPAAGVTETVERLTRAGIRTVMITGDQAVTAEAIGGQLGLFHSGDEVIEGLARAENEDEAGFRSRLSRATVFSRVTPEEKLEIVRRCQGEHEIVAMLGDGVNDAPALKQADIGVAMGGRGTDVARETADLVLLDDRLETIAAAVEEGRIIFDNIRKFVFYLFSCNLSEALVLLLASVSGVPLPVLPLQILWLNLITDVFPALALAAEPGDDDVMTRPPRDPEAAILSRGFLRLTGLYGLLLSCSTFAAFGWALGVRRLEVPHAMTIAFMTLALTQLFHVFNARSESAVIFTPKLFSNIWVWGAVALTIGLQLATVYHPGLSAVLGTRALGTADWVLILAASAVPLLAGQLLKTARDRERRAA